MNLISSPAKLSRSLVQKKKKKALTVFTTPLLKLVICCVTYRRKDDKIPRSRLKYHRRLPHYSGDWQLQLPSQQDDRAVFDRSLSSCDDTVWCDETGVTASAIYDRDNFFSAAKFVLVFFMLHTELLLHRTENCNFEWTVFLSSAFFFFFLFMDIICPGAYQNNLFILIGVCSTEETKMGWWVLVTLLFHFLLLIARLFNSKVL